MKRILVISFTALFLFTFIGCAELAVKPVTPLPSVEAFPEPSPTATPAPTPVPEPTPTPEPAGEPGTVRINGVRVIYRLLERGLGVTVLGEQDEYYSVDIDGVTALVEKWLVRLDSESPTEAWTGYARSGARVYGSAYLDGEPAFELDLNTEVTVTDELDGILYIECGDIKGYVSSDDISDTLIKKKSKPKKESGGESSAGGGTPAGGGAAPGGGAPAGGGTGGGGGGDTPPPAGGADGGDIQLSAPRVRGGIMLLSSSTGAYPSAEPTAAPVKFPCGGRIKADGTRSYLAFLNRPDPVKVIGQDADNYTLLIGGGTGVVPKKYIQLVSEPSYEEWDGFSDHRAPLYSDPEMKDELEALARNTKLHILEDLGDCYLVQTETGMGFMEKDKVGEKEFEVPKSKKSDKSSGGESESVSSGGDAGGGSTGGGSTGGGSAGGGTGGGDAGGGGEWTEPVL